MTEVFEPDGSLLSLLCERRAELQRDIPDFDRCFALNEAWLRRLRREPGFDRRVAEGEMVLAGYTERQAAQQATDTGAMPEDAEPRG